MRGSEQMGSFTDCISRLKCTGLVGTTGTVNWISYLCSVVGGLDLPSPSSILLLMEFIPAELELVSSLECLLWLEVDLLLLRLTNEKRPDEEDDSPSELLGEEDVV